MMNEQLQQFARSELKKGLAKLPEGWQAKFNRMYGNVDDMSASKLDRAMEQVKASEEKVEQKQESDNDE